MYQPLWTLEGVSLAGSRSDARPVGSRLNGGVARLHDVSLVIYSGVTAVLGYSGAGKTSLLNLLVRFERPDTGRIEFRPPESAKRLPLFWVPQNFGLWPHQSARQQIETVVEAKDAASRRERTERLLQAFDLEHCGEQRPSRMSQGEQARLAVARALATEAGVLVMDEPLAHVDPARTGRYRDVLRDECRRKGTSLVFATHSPDAVLTTADRAVCIDAGRIVCEGAVAELYDSPPDAKAATFLGRANWFEPADAALWLSGHDPERRCYRPEQLVVEPSADGPLAIEAWRQFGPIVEADLRHVETGVLRRFELVAGAETSAVGERCRIMPRCKDA
ncbi:MAG: ATP-binding cassette domain-containing protein [Planctomycetes bacterium]|nr:ATP-binding cassette domain-containing protein [Planctomycetota bacterium]